MNQILEYMKYKEDEKDNKNELFVNDKIRMYKND